MSQTNLHLITPAITDAAAFRAKLEAAVKAGGAKSVHLKFSGSDEQVIRHMVQALAPIVQDAGAALIIDPPSDLREVARWGVDGVHVNNPDMASAAIEALKPDRIVGIGGLRSKDAAMSAGEAGCDYLIFGEPRADGSLPPLEQVVDRCQWWAEVFTTPCIGYAPDLDAVTPLAKTGVEFVAVGAWAFEDDAAAIAARFNDIKTALKV